MGTVNRELRPNKGHIVTEFPNDYVVLDLETTGLEPSWHEIIEIAILKVKDNVICDTYSTLIKPEREIPDFITELTGISNEMVSNSPSLNDVVREIISFIGDDIIVGHNINFDYNFIYDACDRCSVEPISNDYFDTMRISRKLLPDLAHHRLSDLAIHYDIDTINAHRAMGDCKTTFAVFQKLLLQRKSLGEQYNELFKYVKKHYRYDLTKIIPDNTEFDTTHPLYGKVCVFTGTLEKMTRAEAAQIVVNLGGTCGNDLTKKTNYLVIGNFDFSSSIKNGKSGKQKKAEGYLLKGCDINIFSENVFYDLIEM